jgi:hypothetical protein
MPILLEKSGSSPSTRRAVLARYERVTDSGIDERSISWRMQRPTEH